MTIKINNPTTTRNQTTNSILNSGLTSSKDNRYCQHCHIKLVNKDQLQKYIYVCPQCNVTYNIYNTEPKERLIANFPTMDPTRGPNTSSRMIHQGAKDSVSRSNYFINKNLQKKSEVEDADPYLKILKSNNKIRITNIDYNDPTEY
jgi:hypothetical protein